ncbi:MAG: sigma-70 family RNA polymerase sigma factor [Acidobacteria bacterium]|nr:sigma-70 family RNA polymerase sigma factor [Acidobacteriota bacterium]
MDEYRETEPPITKFLQKWRQGDAEAFDELIKYVYNDLRRRAFAYLKHERPDHTLQPTGLVHEAFIKLVDKREIEWEDRNHFFAVAAQAMRRILVDHARTRKRDKRGGKNENLPLDDALKVAASQTSVDLVALDEALNALAAFDERQARIVELKYFAGMTLDETADVLGVSRVTITREWQMARAWLRGRLE